MHFPSATTTTTTIAIAIDIATATATATATASAAAAADYLYIQIDPPGGHRYLVTAEAGTAWAAWALQAGGARSGFGTI
ncbi:hypothetical protein O1611_g2166 [Lasiodiplodia mahajangana]|uniref:Uncharacterized protein n=1 Tax=Lasiodiplodia mahajangana TaxID=1108764 RepID=A0ACC2JVM1_9PEZI|nr:hypothetical protein O1611_g2166 [Lasiodiplodia mahajangana]